MLIYPIQDGRIRPYTIFQEGVPVFLQSSGNMGNNGAFTLDTALDSIYANCYMYFPANAISAGSAAGKYFVQMSSATVGIVYNNTYTSGVPTIPASPTAFVTTGPGAYTQTTGADIALMSFPLLGNSLGANGALFTYPHVICPNNANTKTTKMSVGGTAFGSDSITTTGQNPSPMTMRNKGVTNRNVGNGGAGFAEGGSSPVHGTVDTTADQTVLMIGRLANAADYVGFLGVIAEVRPAA